MIPLLLCVTACFYYDEGRLICYYEKKPSCSQVCVESREVLCRPRIVNLGDWDPRPETWDTTPYRPPPEYK